MRTGKDRGQVEAVNTTVGIGTVRVAAWDIVVADANGVVIVPRQRAREVAETARQVESVSFVESSKPGDAIWRLRSLQRYRLNLVSTAGPKFSVCKRSCSK